MNYETNAPATVKSCCRCGSEFRAGARERVCWRCRKPKATSRQPLRKELSFREMQIVELVAQGKANKEIAYRLLLSEGTIKEYLNRIFRKVAVSNRTELAIWEFTRRAACESNTSESTSSESDMAFEKRPLII